MYMHIQCIIIIWTSQISESSTCMSLSLSLSPSPSLGSSLSPLSLSPFLSITNSALIYVLHSCQSLSPPPPTSPSLHPSSSLTQTHLHVHVRMFISQNIVLFTFGIHLTNGGWYSHIHTCKHRTLSIDCFRHNFARI